VLLSHSSAGSPCNGQEGKRQQSESEQKVPTAEMSCAKPLPLPYFETLFAQNK